MDTKQIIDHPAPVEADSQQLVDWMNRQLADIRSLLEGNIRWQNLRSNLQTVAAPTADVAFDVTHNLGKTPEMAVGLPTASASLYATTEDRAAWTDTMIRLRSSVGGISFTLLVI